MNDDLRLVIDSSSNYIFAGVLDEKQNWLCRHSREGTTLETLFVLVGKAIKDANIKLTDLRSYLYCEGPGSVLGLRLSAMAIETWRRLNPNSTKLYKYNSLRLSAMILVQDNPSLQESIIISDWKKGLWNSLQFCTTCIGKVGVINDSDLTAWQGKVYHLPHRKGWQKPPPKSQAIFYAPERISDLQNLSELMQVTDEVQLYKSEASTFKKWKPKRHLL